MNLFKQNIHTDRIYIHTLYNSSYNLYTRISVNVFVNSNHDMPSDVSSARANHSILKRKPFSLGYILFGNPFIFAVALGAFAVFLFFFLVLSSFCVSAWFSAFHSLLLVCWHYHWTLLLVFLLWSSRVEYKSDSSCPSNAHQFICVAISHNLNFNRYFHIRSIGMPKQRPVTATAVSLRYHSHTPMDPLHLVASVANVISHIACSMFIFHPPQVGNVSDGIFDIYITRIHAQFALTDSLALSFRSHFPLSVDVPPRS